MKIYHFNRETLELMNEGAADQDPFNNWLIPAFATEIEPPVVILDKTRHFIDGTWVYQAVPVVVPDPVPVPEVPPVNPVPQVVSRFQAKAALYGAGHLVAIEALMASPDTPMLMKLAWADALQFERNSTTVLAMGTALGLTTTQVDDLFIAAVAITA